MNFYFHNTDYIKHPCLHLAEQTTPWIDGDTREQWLEKMEDPIKCDILTKNGYSHEDAITYSFNKLGFRTPELDTFTGDYFVALGCSFTMGTALPLDHVWPSVISSRLGIPVCNLGIQGIAFDGIYRLANYILPYMDVKPKFVCLLTPPKPRLEIIRHNNHNTVLYPYDREVKSCSVLREYFIVNANIEVTHERNLHAIKGLLNEMNIPLYIIQSHIVWSDFDPLSTDVARDFLHQGRTAQREMATKFIAKINSL